MKIAEIILQQLGGNKFIAMTGVKHLTQDIETLRMTLPRNKSNTNTLWITLAPQDTYTMRFFKFTPGKVNKKFEWIDAKITNEIIIEGVYCDDLQKVFTEITGFDTHL